jgi:hypothetical protein
MLETILEILKYVLPSLVVFLTAFFVTKSFYNNEMRKLEQHLRTESRKDTLPLRLQAYERLAVFLERISPNNLIPRMVQPDMNAHMLRQTLLLAVRMEYEHNLSQQIYVSTSIWRAVTLVKDELIKDINLLCAAVPPDSPAIELSKRILEHYIESEHTLPMQDALDMVKQEVKKLF